MTTGTPEAGPPAPRDSGGVQRPRDRDETGRISGYVARLEARADARVAESREIGLRLRHRLRAISWWVELNRLEPGGVLPTAEAAQVLAVNTSRVRRLIADGKLRAYQPPTRGARRAPVYVPVEQLASMPTAIESAGHWVTGEDRATAHRLGLPDWQGAGPPEPQNLVDNAKKSGDRGLRGGRP